MKKIILSLFTLSLVLTAAPFASGLITVGSGDTPLDEGGDGFTTDDPCGYVMGTADAYSGGTVFLSSVDNDDQGCVDANGYFYEYSSTFTSRDSTATYSITGGVTNLTIDFTWSSDSSDHVFVDPITGYWSGYAKFTTGSQPWIWFDWTCADAADASACTADEASKYWIRTDLDTGEVSGYALSGAYGFISFNNLEQELPPLEIVTYVDILADDTDMGPEDVDYTNTVLADGKVPWRFRVQFYDTVRGVFLDADDIEMLSITPVETSDSQVYLNQVENTGDAIKVSYANPYWGCTDEDAACVQTEDDGSTSFNKFLYPGAPFRYLGLNNDSDTALEFYSDREGCRWIYQSQWEEVDGMSSQPTCPLPSEGGTTTYDKEDVFYDRQNDRNKWEIDYITINVIFSGDRDVSMYTYPEGWTESDAEASDDTPSFIEVDDGVWRYYVDGDSGEGQLSARPRYQIQKFVSIYDDDEHTDISSDPSKVMSLKTESTVYDTSEAYQYAGGLARPAFDVYYQVDVDGASATEDTYLLLDTDQPANGPVSGDVEETYRTDNISDSYSSMTYSKNYAMGYGQKDSECGSGSCSTATNTVSNPTAEQWVCDWATELSFGDESCYYSEYLPHIDRHQDAEGILVIGAVNSLIDADDILDENLISIQGTSNVMDFRNKMYAQVARYTLGLSAGSGSVNSSGDISGDILEMMNGRLLFAEGDVTIDGNDQERTLVVIEGNVYINSDVLEKLGIIVFKRGGTGGNIYVLNMVNNVYANIYADGSLFSYAGTPPTGAVYPTWYSDEVRTEALMHQFYLKGGLFALYNSLNGAADSDGDGVYQLGGGQTTSDYSVAREYDLNLFRQYRLCYPVNADGTLDYGGWEECGEGETLSEYGLANDVYNSFIIEYDPPGNLPVFTVGSGSFQ